MTLSGWRLGLFGAGIAWAMLVLWNFSNGAVGEVFPLAIASWALPMGFLYLLGRVVSWLVARLRSV